MKQEIKVYDLAFKFKAVELSNETSNLPELATELHIVIATSSSES